ncbi:MAG: bifunctional molybdenum cofactor biosynthesis protein MoaC/MoaB [Chitinophagaceae bacterium]|nr:bifunctional molybdenum cofactor biosynthesis protein MoaC/MoaB [Chitinophagaceae bacterium]MBL0055559.1 bifunctional molybdenum cofactor biosynthesis protein MoaC/MoaB [Chitinophagaceae bacterium]
MKNTSHNIRTHRTAIASATVRVSNPDTITAISDASMPDVFATSRIAAIMAVKRTGDTIPDSHSFPIDYAEVHHRIEGLDIVIEVEVQAISKTGITLEALHGASVAALTVYDRLKKIDKGMEITGIRIIKSKGGKDQYTDNPSSPVRTAVLVCSDSIAAGTKEDFSGKAIISKLEKLAIELVDYSVIPDEVEIIRKKVRSLCEVQASLIIITGGTGLSDRDVTPEAIRPLFDREIPGIAEAIRSYGQEHMPYAMLSRSLAGLIGKTLVLALPGSTRGAAESMDALFPYLLHYFKVMEHAPHD